MKIKTSVYQYDIIYQNNIQDLYISDLYITDPVMKAPIHINDSKSPSEWRNIFHLL